MKFIILGFLVLLPAAAARAQEGELLKKFQDIQWQDNGYFPEGQGVKRAGGTFEFESLRSKKVGPRFEGWYTRITDRDGARSIAFIVGSFLPEGVPFSPKKTMPGYLAVLVSDGTGKTLRVYETFPEKTALSINGKRVFNEPPVETCLSGFNSDCSKAEFSWSARGYGHVSDKNFSLDIPGEISVKGSFGAPVYWNDDNDSSPEGIATSIPMVPIHWYVHSLGSPSNYEYAIKREKISVRSSGYAHIEKNWGKSFPRKWIWSEGVTDNNSSHYALGGGEVDFGAFKITSFLVGFHTPKVSLDFKPQQGTLFKTIINGCGGSFSIVLARYGKQLVIDSRAALGSFGKVSIPTDRGFVANGGVESFSASTMIEAYDVDVFGNSKLIEKKTFSNSALEFGANYMCGGLNNF